MHTDPHDPEDSAGFADRHADALFWLGISAGFAALCACVWFGILA